MRDWRPPRFGGLPDLANLHRHDAAGTRIARAVTRNEFQDMRTNADFGMGNVPPDFI